MDDRTISIRLDIAKAALIGGASMERMKDMYRWVCGEEVRGMDGISVTEMEQFLGMSSTRFANRCKENGIETIEQLVKVGSKTFRAYRLVGNNLCERVSRVLYEQYGVKDW